MMYLPPDIIPSDALRRFMGLSDATHYPSVQHNGMQQPLVLHANAIGHVPPSVLQEAQALSQQLKTLLHPFRDAAAHKNAVADILDTVNVAVRNPLDDDAINAKISLLCAATLETPERAFTPQVNIQCVRNFSFFPALADIIMLLDAQIKPIRETIARLNILQIKAQWA